MITDDDHPEMARAHQDLMQRLAKVIGISPKTLTKPYLEQLVGVAKDHRIHWRMKGVDFPVMVVVVVPRLGIVEFKRADLELPSIRQSIVNFVYTHPEVTMDEVVTAFRVAYPDLKPGDIAQSQSEAGRALERRLQRREEIIEEAEKIVKQEGDTTH